MRGARVGTFKFITGQGVSEFLGRLLVWGQSKPFFLRFCVASTTLAMAPCFCVWLRLHFVFVCGLDYSGAVGSYEMTHAGSKHNLCDILSY